MKFLGISKCPVGIAHTYMAAEKLELTGAELGHEVKIETQGSVGVENELTMDEIAACDAVIIAADSTVDGIERFNGKKVYFCKTNDAINNPEETLINAMNAPVYTTNVTSKESKSTQEFSAMQHVMNGVGYMIPFIAVFGLLGAIANAFGGTVTDTGFVIAPGTIWSVLFETGKLGSMLMVPALGGYIAFSIAGRAALAPAMISSLMLNTPTILGTPYGYGFLGAIIIGLITGYGVKKFLTIKFPQHLMGILPTLIVPFVFTLFNTLLFYYVLQHPVTFIFNGFMEGLVALSSNQGGLLLLGAVLGAMCGTDMGGPINKAGFMFTMVCFETGNFAPYGAFACTQIVTPLGLSMASMIGKKYFTKQERDLFPTTLTMCCVGFSEGAIPYAANDLKTVIPSSIIGSAVTGAMAMSFGITNIIIKGGPIPVFIGGINEPVFYFLSMFTGAAVTCVTVIFLKSRAQRKLNQ